MDRHQWLILRRQIRSAARSLERHEPPRRRPTYPDWLVVAMYLFAVDHDRPTNWACDPAHYGRGLSLRRPLPSVSQFHRRLRTGRIRRLLQTLHDQNVGPPTTLSYVDGSGQSPELGKPLVVGVASKDPDARRGHVLGGFARGYKLHAWMTDDRRITCWAVYPLNVAEQPVAEQLAGVMPCLPEASLVLADQNYDSHRLHKAIDARGGRLLVWPKGGRGANQKTPMPAGQERHEVTMRQMGPARRALLRACRVVPSLVRMVLRQRANAEGILGNLTSRPGGLGPLPAWVRRIERVRRWVGGKILLYNLHVHAKAGRLPTA
ncbi:MAG: transposase [Planctomycetota bacterium]